jgi:hypothetical protein
MPPLKDEYDKIYTSPEEKAELIGKQFFINHQNPLAENDDEFSRKVHTEVTQTTLNGVSTDDIIDYPDDDELVGVIRKLKNSKSPGVDGIRNILLKKLPERGRLLLLLIICACMKLSYFPTRWKHAKVVAIPKPGKNLSIASSYRPISLLSSISKILERLPFRSKCFDE